MMKIATVLFVLVPFCANAAIVFEALHDSGGVAEDYWPNPSQYCCDHSISLSTDIAREGSASLKVLRFSNDPPPFSNRNGAEVSTCCENFSGNRYDLPSFQTVWLGFSMYLPSGGALGDYPFEDFTSWNNLMQVIPGSNTCANSVGFSPEPNQDLYIYRRTSNVHPCSGVPAENFLYQDGPMPQDQWIDFVYEMRMDNTSSGFLRIWMNNNQIVNYSGSIGWPVGGSTGYLKFGTYANPSTPSTRTVYYDSIRVCEGTCSFSDVDPAQGGTPPPDTPIAPTGLNFTLQ